MAAGARASSCSRGAAILESVLIAGIVGVQKEAVLAAARAVVTVEEVVDDLQTAGTNAVVLPAWTVHAIAVVPGGARPSYAHGYYQRDSAFYTAWDAIARDRDSFTRWIDDEVIRAGAGTGARA